MLAFKAAKVRKRSKQDCTRESIQIFPAEHGPPGPRPSLYKAARFHRSFREVDIQ